MPRIEIYQGDNLQVLKELPKRSIDLIYIDPPFNTGKSQKGRKGSYADYYDDFLGFIEPRLVQAYRLLKRVGSLFFHLDYREIHYCKILLDEIFGRECFINEIIWAYDYGGRSKRKWPTKHDTILWYAKDPEDYTFNFKDMDRLPYRAPNLAGKERVAIGKTPTDVWWNTIVQTCGKERTGYPTQKPLAILNRIVKIHSNPRDTILDFFAGSGSMGEAAYFLNRNSIMIDKNPEAIEVMKERFKGLNVQWR